MGKTLATIQNNRLAVIVMMVSGCFILLALIWAPLKYPTMQMSLMKFMIGYSFLLLLFLALLHVMLVRTQTITIFSDQIQIKSITSYKAIQWRDVQTFYFSEREVEYSFLNSYSPALVLELKDGTRYLIWCSQKRKAEACRKLAARLQLLDGVVELA